MVVALSLQLVLQFVQHGHHVLFLLVLGLALPLFLLQTLLQVVMLWKEGKVSQAEPGATRGGRLFGIKAYLFSIKGLDRGEAVLPVG